MSSRSEEGDKRNFYYREVRNVGDIFIAQQHSELDKSI